MPALLPLNALAAPQFATGTRNLTDQERALVNRFVQPIESTRDLPGARRLLSAPPPKVTNYRYLPVVYSQQLNDCAAFAPSYYLKTYQEAREHGWLRPDPAVDPEHVMSPGFTFPLSNGGENVGANTRHVMYLICRYGIASWKDMPENPYDWYTYPTESVWRRAAAYRGDRVLTFNGQTDAGLTAIKAHLASGDLLVLDLMIYHDVYDNYPNGAGVNNEVIYANGTNRWDNHTFTLIGYDDTKTYNAGGIQRTGAFLAVNSWGTAWGVTNELVGSAGCVWFGYDYIKRDSKADVIGMTDRIGYQPTDFLVMDIEHARAAELTVEVKAGPAAGGGWLEAFPNSSAIKPFRGRIVTDVTDFAVQNPLAYWLRVEDVLADMPGWPVALGQITRAWVERGTNLILTAEGLPLKTVDDVNDEVVLIPIGAFQKTPLYEDGTTLEFVFGAWADVDQDGDLDLIAAGYVTGQSTNFTRLYRNDQGVFREEDVGLPGAGVGTMAFGDYNGDGYPDLLMSYYDPAAQVGKTRLFRNQAGNGFVDSGINFPALTGAAVAWGDYDNDGDVDLLLAGFGADSKDHTYLLRNDRTNFVDSGISLPGVRYTPVSWVDFNNDGLLDCMIGETLYRHYPNGTFQKCDSSSWIYGGWRGAHAWGDYNGDGLPDLAVCMIRDAGSQPRIVTRIYRNDGETFYPGFEPWPPGPPVPDSYAMNFTEVATNLPGVYGGNLQWADMDNDGRLDLVICGAVTDSDGGGQTLILRQQADGSFADMGLGLAGFTAGFITVVDADNDGALDLFAAGSSWPSDVPPPVLGIYRSVLANQAHGPWAGNAPPGVPIGRYAWSAPTGYVHLSWSAPLDDHTPSPSLSYRVRVGTQPGACDIVSPAQGVMGLTHGQHAGLLGATPPAYVPVLHTNTAPGLRLRGLAPGRYYWSVQAVDGSQAASPWSEEQFFTAGPGGLRDGDVNQDGVVDIADLVLCRRMLQGRASTNLDTADLDGNGRLEENDLRLLAAQLLGLNSTTNYLPLTQTNIGLAGGRIFAGNFELVVPSGTFRSNALVGVSYSYDNRPPGWQSSVPLFHISGVPASLGGSLIVRMPDTRSSATGAIELAIGQMTPSRENAQILERAFTSVTGTQDPDGWLRFEVSPSLLFGAETASGLRLASLHTAAANGGTGWQSDWKIDFDACLLENWSALMTRHFKIYWQAGGLSGDKLNALGNELEQVYDIFKGYGFESARDMVKNPVKVWLIEIDDEGGCVYYTAASAYINLRKKTVNEDDEKRATTVCHEFFHVVQGLIHPNSIVSQAFDDHLKLFNEATATWSESMMVANPVLYVPELYLAYRARLFDGYAYSANLKTASQSGYAFSALIDFLSRRHPGIVTNIYYNIQTGSNAVDALLGAVPITDTDWHDDFYRDLILGNIYPARPLVQFSAKEKPEWPTNSALVVDIATATNRQKTWYPFIAGLGAAAYQVTFASNQIASLTHGEALAFALHNEITQDENLDVFTALIRTDPEGTFPVTADYSSVPGTRRHLLRNLNRVFEPIPKAPIRSVLALVVRTNPSPSQRDKVDLNTQPLNVGVVYELNGSTNLLSQTVVDNNYFNSAFPQFQCSGSIELNNCIGTYTNRVSIDSSANSSQSADLVLWQDGSIAIPITFNANPIAVSLCVAAPFSGTNRYTISNVGGYQLTKRDLAPPNDTISTEYPGNSFSLHLAANEDRVYYTLKAKFNATAEYLNNEGQVLMASTSTNRVVSLLTVFLTRK